MTATDEMPTALVPDAPDAQRPLPGGWRWVRLGDVCSIVIGRTPRRDTAAYWGGDLPWVSISDLSSGTIVDTHDKITELGARESRSRLIRAGTLLFSFKLSIGKMAITGMDLYTNEAIAALLPKDASRVDVGFLRFALSSIDAASSSSHAVKGKTLNQALLHALKIPLPPLSEQRRIAATLTEQVAAVERARAAAQAQLELSSDLIQSYLHQSLSQSPLHRVALGDCLIEVSRGVGATWSNYRVVGATRAGLAPAKERVGKSPERYKLVDPGTVFYNPMRILLGSIAMIDEGDESGITSPDYVAFKTQAGVLHPRWFYYWLRSRDGEAFIKTLTRGAVRERMLFRRLAAAEIQIPAWEAQCAVAVKLQAIAPLKHSIQSQLDAIGRLPGALLRRAFSGEL